MRHVRATQLTVIYLALLTGGPGDAHANRIYRWVDEHGVTHYTDRPPDQAVAETREVEIRRQAPAVGPLAQLVVLPQGRGHVAVVRNRVAGPIEVLIEFGDSQNAAATPALPHTVEVPALGELHAVQLRNHDPSLPGRFSLHMQAIPGPRNPTPDDVDYLLPLAGERWRISQGFGGSFSHTDPPNRHAVDFGVAEGTPVLAARDGVVMDVARDFVEAGQDLERDGGRANYIRILHEDGTMAVYAHLQAEGTLVTPGRRVRAGQRIGYSGNTGFSTGPHLHFVVQVNRGMRLESIPVRIVGPDGPLSLQGR